MRICRLDGCEEEVEGRRRYCSYEHAHEAKLAGQRRNWLHHGDEYNENRRQGRAEGQQAERDEGVIDYTRPGAASKPPSFDIPQQPARRVPVIEPQDPRVENPALRIPQLDMSQVPGDIRRDLVRAQRHAKQLQEQEAREGQDVVPWDMMQATQAEIDNSECVVDFSRPPPGSPALGPRPQPRVNALGQSIPRPRRWG